MPSEKDICIYALQHIGEFADFVSLDEDSSHATVAKTAYPFTRDSLLERHTWNFATRAVRLAPSAEKPLSEGWYAYPLPTDCIRVVDVYSGIPYETPTYQLELVGDARCVVTPAKDVWIRYIRKVKNTDFFTPGFVEALSWNLAATIAGPIVKGDAGITATQKLTQYAQVFEQKAAAIDAGQGRTKKRLYDAPWHEPWRNTGRRDFGPTSMDEHVRDFGPTPMDERGDFER